ncbi:MAG: 16S rRNA (guanine(527)-N(7))-methyltransferase RsmG [Armatimonadota bacterium]
MVNSDSAFLPIELLRSGAAELGIQLDDLQIYQLDQFARLLVETNKTLNLTRITQPDQIVTGHYLDSLSCLTAVKIKKEATILDIGTGAGFPGVPIKIARPDLDVTLMDSSGKKLKFIDDAIAALGLSDIRTINARAENAGKDPAHREKYDIAIARALADMKALVELCLPLVKVGGSLIAQKSEASDEEIDLARPLIGQLGGSIEKVSQVTIPKENITRRLVVVAKNRPTPPDFPRPYSKIIKSKSR